METQYVYTKPRSEFGRQCIFSDRPAEIVLDIPPNSNELDNYIERSPCEMATQCVKEMSEHEVNTERCEYAVQGVNHVEGGWPKDVNFAEPEQVARFRKKVEKEENYTAQVVDLATKMEAYIKQNNAIDIYEDYFARSSQEPATTDSGKAASGGTAAPAHTSATVPSMDEPPSARTLNVLRDPKKLKRTANHLSWNSDGTKLAVAYCSTEFTNTSDKSSYDSYVWDIDSPNKPSETLSPQNSPCVTLEYNPKDQHIVLGGCLNGQICYWDTRRGPKPVDTSPIEKSHRDPANGILWMQTKTGTECFTASSDGQVYWWDTRKGLSEPVDSLILDPTKKLDLNNALGATVLEYESTMPTKFMVGTEQGSIISCNRKAKTAADKIAALYNTHSGPIYALERNPFAPKVFLSVGDWTTRIWSEDVKESSIIATKYHDCYLSDAAWSPHRPAVFYSARKDGYLDCWDLLFKQNTPTLSVSVFNESLKCCRPNPSKGGIVACGSADGQTALISLSSHFYQRAQVEKGQVSGLFDRETKREKILESRQKELKLKERERSARATSGGSEKREAEKPAGEEEAEGDEVADTRMDFNKALQQQLKTINEKHEIDADGLVYSEEDFKNLTISGGDN